MDVIRRVCDRVGVMDGGVIVEHGLVSDVFLHPQHPTTQRFVQETEGDTDLDAKRGLSACRWAHCASDFPLVKPPMHLY